MKSVYLAVRGVYAEVRCSPLNRSAHWCQNVSTKCHRMTRGFLMSLELSKKICVMMVMEMGIAVSPVRSIGRLYTHTNTETERERETLTHLVKGHSNILESKHPHIHTHSHQATDLRLCSINLLKRVVLRCLIALKKTSFKS